MTPHSNWPERLTPLGSMSLTLWIQDCSCRCGQKWVHSYLTYNNGGRPLPKDEDKFSVNRIEHARRNHSHCHRRVPLGLGVGWEPVVKTSAAAPASKQSKPSALELLKRIG